MRTHNLLNKAKWAILCGSVALVGGLWFGSQAAAQGKGSPQVIELDEEVIEGRLQKPEAFYILQHTSLNYERIDPKESFVPEMIESVKKDPF